MNKQNKPEISPNSSCAGRAAPAAGARRCASLVAALILLLSPRAGAAIPYEITSGPRLDYDPVSGGRNCIVSPIDADHHLCLYKGTGGKALVLTVNPVDWSLQAGPARQYDANGDYMGLAAVDPTHYLCTYCGSAEAAYASILTVDPLDWSIAVGSTMVYDPEFGYYNALSPVDATHNLGVHNMWDVTGRAGIFTVDPQSWAISYGHEITFEPESGFDFKLIRIDATHHLCIYPSQAGGYYGRAVVLVVDPETWTVSRAHPPVTFATDSDAYCFASPIDESHFLCAYQGPNSHGWAVVLSVDPLDWSITLGPRYEYDPLLGGEPNLSRIDSRHHLCAYKGEGADGYAVVLTVDPADWSIHRETPYEWDPERADYPYLSRIDDGHYVCSYEGPGSDGWALVLSVEQSSSGIASGNVPVPTWLAGSPNPFAGTTTIAYRAAAAGPAELSVWDARGRRVRTLVDRWIPGGPGAACWDGTDSRGHRVDPGLYFCTFTAGGRREVVKLSTVR